MTHPPVAVTIAGTDSGGAAGIAADLTTFAALGVHGACVVTAVTAQDTTGVHGVHAVPPAMVGAQLDAVTDDLPVAAVKTGMLGSAAVVADVADRVARGSEGSGRPALVVDPVLVATSGAALADESVLTAFREVLLPVATVATPNLAEARALAGHDGPPEELAVELAGLGCAVVVTGGPDEADAPGSCTDWIAVSGSLRAVTHPVVDTSNDHGTGCTYSAAFAARLAHGDPLVTAAELAAAYTTRQLVHGRTWTLGRGRGPIAHTPATETDTQE